MKRRGFFKSLVAVAAVAFADPLALLKPKPKWVLETKYEQFYVDKEPMYDPAIVKGYFIAEYKTAYIDYAHGPDRSVEYIIFHKRDEPKNV